MKIASLALPVALSCFVINGLGQLASAAIVLDYWNFNNATAGTGGGLGTLNTSNITNGTEIYNATPKTLAPASQGIFALTSVIQLGNLNGTMGGASNNNWGTFAGSTINALSGDSSGQALAISGGSNNGKFIEFDVSTLGYKNIVLSYALQGTATGFRTNKWQYSIDGGATYTDYFTLGDGTTNFNSFSLKTVDFTSATAINNLSDVRFRVVLANATTASSGNNRFDNIQIVGSPASSRTLVWTGSADSAWDTSASNWLVGGTPTAYASGDTVQFTDSAIAVNGGTVAVAAGLAPNEIDVQNNTGTYTFAGLALSGSGDLVKSGSGTLAFAANNTGYTGNIKINAGTVLVPNSDLVLTATTSRFQLNGGTLQMTANSSSTFSQNLQILTNSNSALASTIDTNGRDLTMPGYLTAAFGVVLNKAGSGALILPTPDSNPPGFMNGDVNILAGSVKLTGTVSTSGYGALGGNVKVQSGATLHLDGVSYYGWSLTNFGAGFVDLFDGATLKATGTSALDGGQSPPADVINQGSAHSGYNVKGPSVLMGSSTAAVTVSILAPSASDSLTITGPIQQYTSSGGSAYANPAYATIQISGSGRVVLQGGGVYNVPSGTNTFHDNSTFSNSTFAGDWVVTNGILQIGPVTGDPLPANTNGLSNAGPYTEPLNSLGFKSGSHLIGTETVARGDADLPNTVTLNGGILALGADAPNTNPNFPNMNNSLSNSANFTFLTSGTAATFNFVTSENPTPNYLRNPIVLAGGAIAATGPEVSYGASLLDPQGVPVLDNNGHGVPVQAQFGGNFTVSGGTTSKVLTYNPVVLSDGNGGYEPGFEPGGRTVLLVGGSRSITNQSSGFNPGDTITYSTTWNGTLEVDPGDQTGGAFVIARDAGLGTVTVSSSAVIQIDPNATVRIGGSGDALSTTGGGNVVAFTGSGSGPTLGHLVFDRSADLVYAGTISGAIDLMKTGAGNLILSGTNNSYLGSTAVNAGTLTITSSGALAPGTSLNISSNAVFIFDPSVAHAQVAAGAMAVPEPGTWALLVAAFGMGAFQIMRHKRKKIQA